MINHKNLISVIFSFRNEEDNINELVRRTVQSLDSIESIAYELIFVDDDSNDNSFNLLQDLMHKHPIKIISMSRKFGVTPCVMAGFNHSRGDCVVYLDSDLQDPPELIPAMYREYLSGFDVIHTVRTSREGEGYLKLALTKFAYKIINKISDIELIENSGDYKLLSRRVVNSILSIQEFDPYMRSLSVWVGYNQKNIYYKRNPRYGGVTKFPLFSAGPIREFIRGITANSTAPLYLSIYLGLVMVFLGIAISLYAIFSKINGMAVPGTSGILIVVSLFGGSTMLSMGILGIYIGKIFNQVKGKPRYIVKEIFQSNNEN